MRFKREDEPYVRGKRLAKTALKKIHGSESIGRVQDNCCVFQSSHEAKYKEVEMSWQCLTKQKIKKWNLFLKVNRNLELKMKIIKIIN